MFKHKLSGLVIPQYEHLRLAGAIALLWGNEEFDRPMLDSGSFIKGIALHDFGYGDFDEYTIYDMDNEKRLESLEKLVNQELYDPTANIIAQYHVLRLLGDEPERAELRQKCLEKINMNFQSVTYSKEAFEQVDQITDFCDSVSFYFCLGEPISSTVSICKRNGDTDKTEIQYTIDEQNCITISPWPLSIKSYKGYIVAYEQDKYPKLLNPKIIIYNILPRY